MCSSAGHLVRADCFGGPVMRVVRPAAGGVGKIGHLSTTFNHVLHDLHLALDPHTLHSYICFAT
uniref:Uncharacterized protein n=1 Tax=Timema poppense TaxID=170557 RepID=A0A7R9HCM1_TIMPO|nr:unnamed protein product [Timema poppensis]